MEFISEYAPLVQFVGAFNFVFSTQLFHEHFSDRFISISTKQKNDFSTIKNKMTTDVTTIKSHSPLEHDGKSNQHELDSVNEKYSHTLSKIESTDKKLSKRIESKKQPKYSRQLFLLIGLYSLISIFYICKIGHLSAHNEQSAIWCNAFCALNVITVVWWLYFLISETTWLCKKSNMPNGKMFSPSFSWTIFLYIASVFAIYLWRSYVPDISLQNNHKIYLALFLPLLGFISSLSLFFISNAKLWFVITWYRLQYQRILKNLTKEKDNVLSPYGHLKETSFTIS
jgi:hypothetical protein|nr:MAG TPA: hypothetical protein [Caudoviricetes sp.]